MENIRNLELTCGQSFNSSGSESQQWKNRDAHEDSCPLVATAALIRAFLTQTRHWSSALFLNACISCPRIRLKRRRRRREGKLVEGRMQEAKASRHAAHLVRYSLARME